MCLWALVSLPSGAARQLVGDEVLAFDVAEIVFDDVHAWRK
jgi:hypothetical protein